MRNFLMAVAGNIGGGKTTLARLLGRHGFKVGYESVGDNPFLPLFYKDMKRWSFALQMYFLNSRYDQTCLLSSYPKAVLDRSIYEDAEIFAKNLVRTGKMTEKEYATYIKTYNIYKNDIEQRIPKHSLIVYLDVSVDKCVEHIATRGRSMESGLDREYLEQLDELYRTWVQRQGHNFLVLKHGRDYEKPPEAVDAILAYLPQMKI